MILDRRSIVLFSMIFGGAILQVMGMPTFSPSWLNDGLATAGIALIVVSFLLLVIQPTRVDTSTNNDVVHSWFNASYLRTLAIDYTYHIIGVSFATAFLVGIGLSSSQSQDHTKQVPLSREVESQATTDRKTIVKTPEARDVDRNAATAPIQVEKKSLPLPSQSGEANTSDAQIIRVFTPRTPTELMDIVATKTKRDAMIHKGAWVHIEGTVRDISEVLNYKHYSKNPFIIVEVEVGSSIESPKVPIPKFLKPEFTIPLIVDLYVDADKWKPQVDKMERGDWMEAKGEVSEVYEYSLRAINGEITSVSGNDGNMR